MKRALSIIAAALMLFSVLAVFSACGEGEVTVGEGPLGAYSPAVRITYSRPYYGNDEMNLSKLGWSFTNNGWFDIIKKELGVRIVVEWSINDYALYFERLNTAIFEGSIPDIVDVSAENSAYITLNSMHKNDLIREIDDLMENYLSDASKELYALAGKEIFYPATYDGKIYALCQAAAGEGTAKSFYYFRKDWLDNLNMPVPHDYDSLEAVLRAFTENDPDLNNEDDTVGMAIDSVQSSLLDAFFNGFGAYPNIWIEDGNGGLTFGTVSEKMRKPLEKLAHYVASGYGDYTPVSGNNTTYMFISGVAGCVIGQTNSILTLADTIKRNPNAEIVAVPAFNEDGSAAAVTCGENAYRYYAVSRGCKYPEVLIKLNNFMLEMTERAGSDIELYNKYFTNAEGTIHAYNYAPVVQEDYPRRNCDNALAVEEALKVGSPEGLTNELQRMIYGWVKAYDDGDNSYRGWAMLYGIDGVQVKQKEFFDGDLYVHNKFVTVPTETMAKKGEELNSFAYLTLGKIIAGEETVDYFDVFVSEWKATGGDDITREVNEWYKNITG